MEPYNWHDQPGFWNDRPDYREREQQPRLDESAYRGAYRLDTDSRHHNVTTYDGFLTDSGPQHGGDFVYRRSRNLQDNDGYTENQYRQNYGDLRDQQNSAHRQHWVEEQHHPRSGGFGSRYGGSAGMEDSRSGFGGAPSREDSRTRSGSSAGSNFNNDYGPDRYRSRPGENYGNMAGSLSVGYDGDFNADQNRNRHYDPLSGEIRNYRDQYTMRHPKRYGPPDKTGSNPDYDRY
ncbi:hypothetical protein OB13_04075 [Pontibacter sp. HJ8]